MPVQTSPPSFPDSFPSFMSVYGGLQPRFEEETSCHLHPSPHFPINSSSRRLHPTHRESVSSSASASTESSPTTTISPFDSPSGGDISPSSSPESPSAMPLSYPKFTPPARALEVATRPTMSDSSRLLPTPKTARPPSPGRRARNSKNLSLRMPPPTNSRPPIATASLVETSSSHHLSAPLSPIQIPQKSNRRRPAGLTIQTPSFKQSFSGSEIVPPTPTLTLGRQSLRHAESSPSLASFASPGFAPRGGMSLPPPPSHNGLRRFSEDASSSLASIADEGTTFSTRVLPGLEEEDDHLDSRESTKKKERGYPEGPIRIHDEGVYLYLEPTAEEASEFDTVINVAKEVRNPFNKDQTEKNDTVMSTWRNASMASKRFSIEDPQTAMSEVSFKSAFEFLPSESESATPTTPTPKSATIPEYLHVAWDHNSEILDDLLPLCELIDQRISEGKKVLVHCQLGASRSASLVIAYGLYKNRHLDFNSMYEMVKGRSQWVGPNMSLIYQLTDFRGHLMRGSPSRPAPREWFVQSGRRCSEPQLTREERATRDETPRPPFRGLSQAPSMGCLSIPSSSPARPKTSDNGNRSPKRSLSPRPLPFRQKFQSVGLASGRPRGIPRSVSSCDPLVQRNVFVRDAPEIGAGLFSPRTSTFLSPPPIPPPSRGIAHVADVASTVNHTKETADPRSPPPPAGGDRMIMRNIDEFL
ncbi:hypothetical protein N7478_009494 [Penicillium angulare]|uniref:uncharacterized protein n=1 Tax=Penicillium angulare TaxID=116970 RepID=UPI0025424718|nr:uncharacterized protein N7478_009494 [Penicillium angulare]KAJ5266686.1 hypothetical protein N7478_009494 [Penicillium angulare]